MVREVRVVGEAMEVVLAESVTSIAPGQSAVFYRGKC